eukprot:5593609-Ditylum_brightwellii.AAC.1
MVDDNEDGDDVELAQDKNKQGEKCKNGKDKDNADWNDEAVDCISETHWRDFLDDECVGMDSHIHSHSSDNIRCIKTTNKTKRTQCKNYKRQQKSDNKSHNIRKQSQIDDHRRSILRAASSYLNRPVELKN